MGSGLGSTGSSLPGGSSGPSAVGSSGGGGGGGGGRGSRAGFGLVLQSLAKPGSRVAKGDVVAEFDREDMLNRLDDFKARVTQAEASMKSVRAQLEVLKSAHDHSIGVAKADLDKTRLDLKTIPVRSANDTERLRLAAEEAEAAYKQLSTEVKFMETSLAAQLRIAELTRDEAVIEFKRTAANADRMVVRAPIDGIAVMQTTFRGGEMSQIQQGDQVHPGQPFMQIVDPDSMLINATVNQVDAERMRIGAKAKVRFDAYPNLQLPATVHSIGAMPKTGGARGDYVKEIPITLKLDELDPRVIPDLSVSVDVVLEAEKNATLAPRESIFRDGPDGRPFVFVRARSGWQRREVEIGTVNFVAAAVRSGVKPGDVLAAERPPRAQAP